MPLLKKSSRLFPTGTYIGWRILSIVLFGGMLASFIISSYFIYQYIYRALEDANTIIVLNSSLGVDTVNKPLFLQAQKFMEKKATPVKLPTPLRNIFVYVSSTQSVAGVSTTASTSSTP